MFRESETDLKTITPSLLDDIKRRVVEEIRPAKIYLFGSHAWGNPGRDSDIDIFLVVERLDSSRGELLRRAYHCISDLRVPTEFVVKTEDEMIRFAKVSASLIHKVLERGVLLYG